MNVLGLDLSLTAPGFSIAPVPTSLHMPKGIEGPERIAVIRDAVIQAVTLNHVEVVAIEGYSFGSTASRAHAQAELGGVVRLWLYEQSMPYVEIAPATLKKFATGSGVADKFAMGQAAKKRAPDIEFSDDNACDAWWLQQMAIAHYDPDNALVLPASHLGALKSVHWPELKAAA